MRSAGLGLALVLACTSLAHGNGRPPATNGVFFKPNDARSVYVRSTFGLLVSDDDGCSFRWVCEQSVGYGGTFDPKYAIAADGTLFATTYTGLRVSRDNGCTFTTATAELPVGSPGRIADIWVDALDVGPTGEIWVATAESGKENDVLRSTDGGVTFVPRGMASPVVWWKSVMVAPSDAQHVYLSGYQVADSGASTAHARMRGTGGRQVAMEPTAHLYSTIDGGEIWTASALTGVQLSITPVVMVAAIDPANPQHVFITSVQANPPDGDRLYRSIDGGTTFTEVLATTQPIVNVVIRDATTVLVATGKGGTYRSGDAGATFGTAAMTPQLGCLGKRSDGTLIGCAPNWDPDFMAVGRSGDATQWDKVFRFVELGGIAACPAGTPSHDLCDPLWPALRAQFGATGPTCPTATDLVSEADEVKVPVTPGGCCDAGNSPGGLLGFLVGLTAWLLARARH